MRRVQLSYGLWMSLALLSGFFSVTASAQQPLSAFIEASSKQALDIRGSTADRKQAAARREQARGVLMPGVTANGRYAHNQYEIDFTLPMTTEDVIIQRKDQLSGDVTVSMPVVDFTAWAEYFEAKSLSKSADWTLSLTRLNTFIQVVQEWHALVAARATVRAAQRNLDVAVKAEDYSSVRVKVGASQPLELSRATAQVARAKQALAVAKLNADLAERLLYDLSFLEPSKADAELAGVGDPPSPLETYMQHAAEMPEVQAAKHAEKAQRSNARSQGFAFIPAVYGFFTENATNAAGFAKSRQWVTGLTATWVFNYSIAAATRAERAGLERAEINSLRAEQRVRTAIFEAWHRVLAARADLEAAQANEEASARAASDAQARFAAGTSTQLDKIQADRDLFQAEVSRIGAAADLGVARAALYLQSGFPLPQ